MSKKRKNNEIDILLVTDNGLETVGGEQESTKIIINGVKDDYNLGVIQPGNIKNPTPGVHYYPMTQETRIKHLVKQPFAFVKYILKVKKIINKTKPRVIHTQAQVSFFIVSLLRKLKLISKDIEFIHTERGLYTKYSMIFKKMFLFCMKDLDTLVTTTHFNMKYWQEAVFEKGIKLKNSIIENTAGELFETYDELKDKNNSDHLTIGFAGRYADWKNWPLAVEISKKINEKIGNKLRVSMAVGCLDEKSLEETHKIFDDLQHALGSRFNGKINIDLEEMNEFYYDIDIFILTSNHNTESFGRTLVEAMSRKTVVLTTDAGGAVEVVGNPTKVCHNLFEFVDKVLEFYYDQDSLSKEKQLSLNNVKKRYSLSNNINKHLNLYERLLKHKLEN